ncbi:MAG: macro domain-containing protein, partial [Psychrobacillus sp.]
IITVFSISISIPDDHKFLTAVIILAFFILFYFTLWIRANLLNSMKLRINNSTVEIKVGDIFTEPELKVIAFNEYFDTQVDNIIISESTLNGIYINRQIQNPEEFDRTMEQNEHLKNNKIGFNNTRKLGKKIKYKLGTIYQKDDYLLTAFTKFDINNRAYLNMSDYINFLLNFWNEVDVVYNGRSISIPLLGSGMTRFKEYDLITDQELLELLIWSFKISKIKFTYPSTVSIIIHESKKDKVDFYKLKNLL